LKDSAALAYVVGVAAESLSNGRFTAIEGPLPGMSKGR